MEETSTALLVGQLRVDSEAGADEIFAAHFLVSEREGRRTTRSSTPRASWSCLRQLVSTVPSSHRYPATPEGLGTSELHRDTLVTRRLVVEGIPYVALHAFPNALEGNHPCHPVLPNRLH